MLRVMNYWMKRNTENRAIRELQRMTDRELFDIGIPRHSIEQIIRHSSET